MRSQDFIINIKCKSLAIAWKQKFLSKCSYVCWHLDSVFARVYIEMFLIYLFIKKNNFVLDRLIVNGLLMIQIFSLPQFYTVKTKNML